MKLEDQVVSLELAKRLKELGVKQDSIFYHEVSTSHLGQYSFIRSSFTEKDYYANIYSAFTLSELGDILFKINYMNLEEMGYLNITIEMIDRCEGHFYRLTNNFNENIIDDFSEVNVRAKMLIHLLENKLWELPNEN